MNIHFNGFKQILDFLPDALVGWFGVFLVMAIIIVIFYGMNAFTNRKKGKKSTDESSDHSDNE